MIEIIENPWHFLTKEKLFVLPEDKEIIDEHNKKCNDANYKFRTDVMPVPFIGDVINGEIIILLHNPKYVDEWPVIEKQHAIVREKYLKVFTHTSDFPFFCLDPSLKLGKEFGLGGKYWHDRLKDLVRYYGSEEVVLKKIAIIQFNPYSSVKFRPTKKLFSQKYNFYLVKKAIERNAHIILARGKKSWLKAIPELEKYPYVELNSDQNTAISPKNCPALFEKLGFMKDTDTSVTQSFIVYPIKRSKDEYNPVPVMNGGGRSFANCKLEIKDGTVIFKSKDDEIEGVFSLNKFFVLNDYSSR